MFKPAVNFYTSLSVAECKHRLGITLRRSKRPHVQIAKGGIWGTWFYVFRQTYRNNSFRPFLVGRIQETPQGTRIIGRFLVHPLVIIFMLFWYGMATKTMENSQLASNKVAVMLFLVLLLIIGVIASWSQRTELHEYLKDQLSSDKPFTESQKISARKPTRHRRKAPIYRNSVDIFVKQSISESKKRLLGNIDKSSFSGDNPVIGRVMGDWLYLYERPFRHITYLYYFYGRFQSVARGTRITGRFWMNPFLALFVILSIGGVFINFGADIIGYFSYYDEYGHWPLLFPRLFSLMWLLLIGGVVIFGWLSSLSSRNYLCGYLENLFETKDLLS